MNSPATHDERIVWAITPGIWLMLGAAIAVAAFAMSDALGQMVRWWFDRPEYSHGSIMPLIAAFLIWQRRDRLMALEFRGSWWGVALAASGLLVYFLGELATVYTLTQYAFLVVILGIALALVGWKPFKLLFFPLLVLVFMLPLPNFLYRNLSAELQLISSKLGVGFIRLFDVSVLLQGNVIDLGVYQLQVAEACDGLRYLFPLMAFGFVVAYFFKGAAWKRLVLFLSAIPLTIFMNGARIGIIGVTVDRWGIQMAEGFLHDFEGWMFFMLSAAILVAEMYLLGRLGREKLPASELFGIQFPEPLPATLQRKPRRAPTTLVVATVLVIVAGAAFASTVPNREEAVPARQDFALFDMSFEGWSGRHEPIEQVYLDALKLDDYMMGNFSKPGELTPVNLYVAYYGSQRAGESAHSPRSCIPGGGWEISSLRERELENITVGGQTLRVNRAVIEFGSDKQLVYYWFQQRGRVITNEYLAKWYLFWDSLWKGRTDGALVRLVAPFPANDVGGTADDVLHSFAASLAPRLERFVPN
jgi:exosortase D (VPLPA-CTERM-specific)